MRFDGQRAAFEVRDSESLTFGAGDFTVAIVAAWLNVPTQTPSAYGHALLLCKHETVEPYSGPCLVANNAWSPVTCFAAQVDTVHHTCSASTGLNDGRLRLYTARRIAPFLSIRINGSPEGTRDAPSGVGSNAIGEPVFIGGEGVSYQALNGVVAEVVIVRGGLTDAEQVELEAFFNSKYGLW